MDPVTRILIQLAQWWRNPPSRTHAAVMGFAVVAALAIAAVEHVVGWPDWLTTEPVPVRRP
ncbi:MAG TPA: hypothetical protein VE033_11490 [Acetobacteraceae bacterium]|jgi:hypothetical protein|nr:hypothetical protein [Acetobacteraceae bacterium]